MKEVVYKFVRGVGWVPERDEARLWVDVSFSAAEVRIFDEWMRRQLVPVSVIRPQGRRIRHDAVDDHTMVNEFNQWFLGDSDDPET